MLEKTIVLEEVLTGKRSQPIKVRGHFPASPEHKNVALMQEHYTGHKGNEQRGYWRDPINHKLYQEISPGM